MVPDGSAPVRPIDGGWGVALAHPGNTLYGFSGSFEELKAYMQRFSPSEPAQLCWFAASLLSAERDTLQGLLETVPLNQRLEKVLAQYQKIRLVYQFRQQLQVVWSKRAERPSLSRA